MITQVKKQEIIILFDEHGTPTFRSDRESEYFIGLGIAYNKEDEGQIFEECSVLFGLSNQKPLKNTRISITRADKISELIGKLPIHLLCMSINLSDKELQVTTEAYEKFGNLMREMYRNIRERPVAQILHFKLSGICLSQILINYVENEKTNCIFKIFIDDWAINNEDIYFELESQSKHLNEMLHSIFPEIKNEVLPVVLLNTDSHRKRFVDVITSIFSRYFLNSENSKYSALLISNIKSIEKCSILNTNQALIEMFRKTMDKGSREPP